MKVIPNVKSVQPSTENVFVMQEKQKSDDWCKKSVPKRHVWKLQQADIHGKF